MSGATETQKSFHGPAFSPTSLVASPSKKLAMVDVGTPVGRKKRRCGWSVKVLAALLDPQHRAEAEVGVGRS